jgi:hypothetical protein
VKACEFCRGPFAGEGAFVGMAAAQERYPAGANLS